MVFGSLSACKYRRKNFIVDRFNSKSSWTIEESI